jgi:hypothetical protein
MYIVNILYVSLFPYLFLFLSILLNPFSSVADPDPGSGAFLTPGSGIGFFRIPDPNFLGKKFYNSLKI